MWENADQNNSEYEHFSYSVNISHKVKLFHDEGLYHIKTSPLICSPNHWTGFYMTGASVMKQSNHRLDHIHILELNPFNVTSLLLYPPENIRKPEVYMGYRKR